MIEHFKPNIEEQKSVKAHISIKAVSVNRDILRSAMNIEVFAPRICTNVPRMIALETSNEALHKFTSQIRIFPIGFLLRMQAYQLY